MKSSIYVQQLHGSLNIPELKQFDIGEVLGQGAFGKVHVATRKSNNEKVAIKMISKSKIAQRPAQEREKIQKYLQTQPQIMKKCDSPFLIKCYQTIKSNEYEIFVMEYCNGGTLKSVINKRPLQPEKTFKYIREIIQGFAVKYENMQELHRHEIIHRDIKSENIFLHDDVCKIGDFGLARFIDKTEGTQHLSYVGTRTNMAAEMHLCQPYGNKVDMFSLGVILYEMLHGYHPFQNINSFAVANRIISDNYKISQDLCKQAASLISAMMQSKPNLRLDWPDLYTNDLVNPVTNGQRLMPTPEVYKVNSINKKKRSQKDFQLKRYQIIYGNIIKPMIQHKISYDPEKLKQLGLLIINRCIINLGKFVQQSEIKEKYEYLCQQQLKIFKSLRKSTIPEEFQLAKECDMHEQLQETIKFIKEIKQYFDKKPLLSLQRLCLSYLDKYRSIVVAEYPFDQDYINLIE